MCLHIYANYKYENFRVEVEFNRANVMFTKIFAALIRLTEWSLYFKFILDLCIFSVKENGNLYNIGYNTRTQWNRHRMDFYKGGK